MQVSVGRAGAASVVAGLVLALSGPAFAAAPAPAHPVAAPPATPADIARGRALFAGTCGAYCHKTPSAAAAAAAGKADAPYLFDCDWLFGGSDQEIFHTITHGVAGTRMVAFGGAIPDQDVWRIVAYLKSATQCKK